MLQKTEVPEILRRFQRLRPQDADLQDYKQLLQQFHDWSCANEREFAQQAQVLLRKMYPFIEEQLLKKDHAS